MSKYSVPDDNSKLTSKEFKTTFGLCNFKYYILIQLLSVFKSVIT